MSNVVVEWKEDRYAGVQSEIPSRCVTGGVEGLSGGEAITVKMGKSAAARLWKAEFVRKVERSVTSPPKTMTPRKPRKDGKRRSSSSQAKCKSQKKEGKVRPTTNNIYASTVRLVLEACSVGGTM